MFLSCCSLSSCSCGRFCSLPFFSCLHPWWFFIFFLLLSIVLYRFFLSWLLLTHLSVITTSFAGLSFGCPGSEYVLMWICRGCSSKINIAWGTKLPIIMICTKCIFFPTISLWNSKKHLTYNWHGSEWDSWKEIQHFQNFQTIIQLLWLNRNSHSSKANIFLQLEYTIAA